MKCTHNNFDSKVKFTHTKNKRFVCTTFSLGGIRNCETTRLYRRANPCGTHSVWLLWDLQKQFKEACLMIATVCSEKSNSPERPPIWRSQEITAREEGHLAWLTLAGDTHNLDVWRQSYGWKMFTQDSCGLCMVIANWTAASEVS